MDLIAYYEGSDDVKDWLRSLIGAGLEIEFRALPQNNFSAAFTNLPAYVSDILYLDKPDLILAGSLDGIHEKPLISIEFASCTPQYQHALQRFSRMMASVANGCPAVLIMPSRKNENMGGGRSYKRSKAVDFGAVKLMDLYRTPAFVFDWPDDDGNLLNENGMSLPSLSSDSMEDLKKLLLSAIEAYNNLDYMSALWAMPVIRSLVDVTRRRAYENGIPTIDNPGGESQRSSSRANLELVDTTSFIDELASRDIPQIRQYINAFPDYFRAREKTLVFKPSRITAHAGDPYVGMVSYYDIAFCRSGTSNRERFYNLVADSSVPRAEITGVMSQYNESKCPFSKELVPSQIQQYGHHLRHGCKMTKVNLFGSIQNLLIWLFLVMVLFSNRNLIFKTYV